MNPEVKEIKDLILSKIDEQVSFLKDRFRNDGSLLEFELQIKKDLNEYGRILFEKMFPVIFGDGYQGSKVEEYNEEEKEMDTFSCMIRSGKRPLKTLFGTVHISRAVYQYDRDGSSVSLLDRSLDIHRRKISPAVRYYADLLGITTSYSEGENIFRIFTGVTILEKDIDRFTEEKAGEIIDYFSERVKDITLDNNEVISPANIDADDKHERIIYLETDGCHVPTRRRHETDTDWKECKTLLLFEMEKNEVQRENKTEVISRVVNKRYFSSVCGVRYFKKQLKCELEEYCKDDKVRIVCIGDGAAWIWKMIKELIPNGRVEILDWYHVKERVTILASLLFPKDKQENDKDLFIQELKEHLYGGKIDGAIEILKEKYAQTKNRELQGKIFETMGYFENNKERMKSYEQYKEEGICIGSGAIESANKNVIQRRIKLPGCRWLEAHADNMAHMRAEYINGNYDKWFKLQNNPMLAVT